VKVPVASLDKSIAFAGSGAGNVAWLLDFETYRAIVKLHAARNKRKEAMIMTTKKTLIILGILMLVSSGYAYADGRDVAASNGITVFEASAYFDAGPIVLDRSRGEAGPDMVFVFANGITQDGYGLWFDIGSVASGTTDDSAASGSAAGGMSPEEPTLDVHNGITDFTGGPQAD
jgi:hypothetical protein